MTMPRYRQQRAAATLAYLLLVKDLPVLDWTLFADREPGDPALIGEPAGDAGEEQNVVTIRQWAASLGLPEPVYQPEALTSGTPCGGSYDSEGIVQGVRVRLHTWLDIYVPGAAVVQ